MSDCRLPLWQRLFRKRPHSHAARSHLGDLALNPTHFRRTDHRNDPAIVQRIPSHKQWFRQQDVHQRLLKLPDENLKRGVSRFLRQRVGSVPLLPTLDSQQIKAVFGT